MELLAVIVITLAFWLHAAVGFGGGLVSVPILALFIHTSDAIMIAMLFQLFQGGLIVFNMKQVNWPAFRGIAGGLLAGSILGTLYQSWIPENAIALTLAVALCLYVFRSRIYPDLGKASIRKMPKPAVGGIAGTILGGTGIGGPVFAMYYREIIADKESFRATLIATFLICNLVRLIVAVPAGLITPQALTITGYALLPFLCALYLGQKYHTSIPEHVFRAIIDILLCLSAISLFAKALL